MATETLMLQLYTEQEYSSLVTDVYPLEDEAFLFLDPGKDVIVREIASEKIGGIFASSDASAFPVGWPSVGFANLTLSPPQGEESAVLYAPSYVPSPSFSGIGGAILEVSEVGLQVDHSARLALFRGLGA